MRRAGLIAAGVVGVLALAGLGAWLALFRDTAEPVSVGDAVTSFRTETDATRGASPISPGVYVYATSGYEKTDALTGVTHRYPLRSTITVAASECGMSLTWRVLKGRSTAWTFCVTDEGWELRSQDERHTFFGNTERTTYTCESTPIWLRGKPVGAIWPVACATDDATESGRARVVRRVSYRLRGGPSVTETQVRKTTRFSGVIRGTARYDFFFYDKPRSVAGVTMTSRTTNESPVGDVHYEEIVRLALLSIRPRR